MGEHWQGGPRYWLAITGSIAIRQKLRDAAFSNQRNSAAGAIRWNAWQRSGSASETTCFSGGKRLRERSDGGNEADGSLHFVADLLNQFVDLRPRIMFGGGFQG